MIVSASRLLSNHDRCRTVPRNTLRYQFSQPDETVVETGEFNGDDTRRSKSSRTVKIESQPHCGQTPRAHVDAWVYVTEVDERP